ncbi:MAG TPA: LysM peptidoglycan-binding domain-containing protein [Candidatus Limnocylindria bacterium]|nr:LysM peptidoglycan-binding domain-containing protein [Candidatus Limnocylindria bacterium]
MLRIARSRRGLSALLVTSLLTFSIAMPAVAGEELVVERGDTLWDLARRHGVTVADLAAWNRIENPSLIRIGQRLVLQPPPTPAAAVPPPPAAPAPVIHVVRAGDTLWDIAIRYQTTVAVIASANQLANPSLIRVGQALAIPPAASSAPPPATAAAQGTPAPALPTSVTHVVQRGETLWAISARYGVPIQAIVDANTLASASFIRTGQQLVIPSSGSSAIPTTAATTVSTAGMSPDMASKVATRGAARDLLLAAATEFGVPASFVLAVSWHESGWQPGVVSHAGAVGLMQLMPATADWVAGAMLHELPAINDPRWNARAGVRLLAYYLARYQGNKTKVLAAYLQGMTSVDQIGVLVSSQPYINSILALEVTFSR